MRTKEDCPACKERGDGSSCLGVHLAPLVEVELWSTHPDAVNATRGTIAAIPGGGGDLIEKDGRFYLRASNSSFVVWACEKQGYVKRVIR